MPFTLSSLSPFYKSNPSNLMNGFHRGVSNVVIGATVSVGLNFFFTTKNVSVKYF